MSIDLSRLVKPLVWVPDSGKHTSPQRMKAIIPGRGGDYTVFGSDVKDEWMWCRNGYFVDGHQMQKSVALELAQAAANADHAARVLASLDTALIEELVGALGDARTDLAAYVDADYPPDTCAQYPDIARRHHRDMELCRRIDATIAKLKEATP